MEVRVGLFLPNSEMFPKLALDFLNGIKLPFKNGQASHSAPKYIIESIGNGTDSTFSQRIEKMLLQEEADLIICFCSYFLLENVVAIANTYKKPIIHVTLGARVLKPIHYSTYVVHQSLNLCHTSYLSGKHIAEKMGTKVAMLSSFYDGGYHLAEAFYNGLTDYSGEVINNYVSPMDYKSESFQKMIDGIELAKPDALFCIFSHIEGNKVMDKLIESGLDAIPSITIPLMTDESLLVNDFYPSKMHSIASWAFDDDTIVMKNFCFDYKNQYEEVPTIFSLLGYEVGSIILHCNQSENKFPNKIGDYIKTQNLVSPRGSIQYTEYNESLPETFKIRKLEKVNGNYQNTVLEEVDSSCSEIIYKKMENLPDTGWKNPYICT